MRLTALKGFAFDFDKDFLGAAAVIELQHDCFGLQVLPGQLVSEGIASHLLCRACMARVVSIEVEVMRVVRLVDTCAFGFVLV